MNTPRETVYSTLFTTVKNVIFDPLEFKTVSRKTKLWTEVPPEEQPAAFMRQVKEVPHYDGRGVPNKWELFVDWAIYVNGGGGIDADIAMPLINACLDRFEEVFPYGSRANNLGLAGVSECRIFGDIEIGQGTNTPQSVAVLTIRVVAV